MRKVHVLPNEEMYAAAAEHVAARSAERVRETGRFTIALTGGETPGPLYRKLAEDYRDSVDWSRWQVFWSDERCVPPDDKASNFRLAWETLLAHVPIPEENIHRMRGEGDPHGAAASYEREVREAFGADAQMFDIMLLGMGADGHVASLFPGSRAVQESERLVVANFAPELRAWRITFTFPLLNQAREVVFLVASPEKRDALNAALGPDAFDAPAARVRPAGDIHWYVTPEVGLDEALAA
jgi:6-phosphogluconolactonase